MLPRRVFITGIGLVTPLGRTTTETWTALIGNESGISYWPEEKVPVARCSKVTAEELKRITKLNPKAMEPRFISLSLLASEQAVEDAGLCEEDFDALARNVGVIIGCGMGSATSEIPQVLAQVAQGKKFSPFFVPRLLPNLAGGNVSIAHNLQGPLLCPSTACASGAHAIADGFHMIQRGEVEVALCGGTESVLDQVSIAGFNRLKALSNKTDVLRASIPFDEERDGFVMGEGAGVLILESEEHFNKRKSRKQNAQPYAIISGAGMSGDANHVTSPHPGGRGAEMAMKCALRNVPDKSLVAYCNAHATSTPMGDLIEAEAIARVFEHSRLAVSSTKSSHGHLLGAAGAVEAAITALALRNATIPGTIGLERLDSKLVGKSRLDFPNRAITDCNLPFALTNSFGFGGTNVSLCLERVK